MIRSDTRILLFDSRLKQEELPTREALREFWNDGPVETGNRGKLTLGELEALAGSGTTRLLALAHAGIAGQ